MADATDTVNRVQQILAEHGIRVGRATAGVILQEVSSAATGPAPRADGNALRNQYTDVYGQPVEIGGPAPRDVEGGHGRGGREQAKIKILLEEMGLARFVDAARFHTVQAAAGYIYLQGGSIPDYLAAQLGIDLTLAESLAFMVRSLAPEASFPGIGGGNSAFLRQLNVGEAMTAEATRGTFEQLLEENSVEEAQARAVELGATAERAAAAVPPAPVSHEMVAGPGTEQLATGHAGVPGTPDVPGTSKVWIVGPDGNPMLATLASAYQPPSAATQVMTPEQIDARIEQLLASGQAATQEEAEEKANEEAMEFALQQTMGTSEADRLIGVPEGYVASRVMQQYRPPELHPGGMAAGVMPAGTGVGEVEVALEPQYNYAYLGQYYSMAPEDLATLQEGMVKAGLLEEGSQTGNPVDSYDAFVTLLSTANWRGESWADTLAWLANTRQTQLPTFRPSAYQAPDYDFLAENIYSIFSRDLGRDPEEWEVRQLADRLGTYYYQNYQAGLEAERRAFLEENNLPTPESVGASPPVGPTPSIEGLRQRMAQGGAEMAGRGYNEGTTAPLPASEDPYSSFMQYFRQHYRPEMDMRKQVANNAYGRDNLFRSIARMDTMIGGG